MLYHYFLKLYNSHINVLIDVKASKIFFLLAVIINVIYGGDTKLCFFAGI